MTKTLNAAMGCSDDLAAALAASDAALDGLWRVSLALMAEHEDACLLDRPCRCGCLKLGEKDRPK